MAAAKVTTPTGPGYQVLDVHGKVTTVQSASNGNMVIANSASSVTLSKANVNDLLTVLQSFASTGVIT